MSEPIELPIETPQVWLRYAEGDFDVASRELTYEQPVYHTVCFLCQGAVEKFLKGYLIAQGWELIKTHDIVELLGYCYDYAPDFAEQVQDGRLLNAYITAGRYPGEVPFEDIGPAEAREALAATRRIRDAVLARLPAHVTQET